MILLNVCIYAGKTYFASGQSMRRVESLEYEVSHVGSLHIQGILPRESLQIRSRICNDSRGLSAATIIAKSMNALPRHQCGALDHVPPLYCFPYGVIVLSDNNDIFINL